MLAEVFAKNVRIQRKIKGFSQEKLAELSGLHRTYIASIEINRRNVSLKNVEKIAIALDMKATDLLECHFTNDNC